MLGKGNVWKLAAASLMAMGALAACTTYEYKNYGARQPDKYFGTQPGYHKLSDHFSVQADDRLMKFYVLGKATQDKEQIGIVATFWFDRSNYGPREVAYAISEDGKRLLFFDEPGVGEGRPVGTKNGTVAANLYMIDAANGRRQLLYPDVHRRSTSCVDLPRNYIRFGKIRSIGNIEGIAYSTDGAEISLEARRKALWDHGEKDKICGPL
jgi:hypothetical protein